MGIRTVIALGLLTPLAAVFAQDSNDVVDLIDSRYESTAKIARDIWEYAEVGYQETKSSNLLQATLNAEGFSIQAGVAKIPTAFVAIYGSGEPVIAILAEFDALPGINQDSVPTRLLIDEKAAGHACGHNLFAAGSIGAAIAVKHWLEESGSSGTLKLLGTPAEEGGSGKVYMVRDGLFDDVDVALTWHPGDNNSASASTTLANRSGKFRFRGISAHAAAAPENARSALDGVEAFNHMINMMREHVPQETRIHYVITDGGNAPNVVPDFAEVYYYVRHPDAEIVKDIWARLENAAKGAAMGTGVDVDWEIIHGNYAVMLNETLSVMMDEKLRLVGGVQYNEYEQSFAEEIYRSFDRPKHALGSQEEIQPYTVDQTYASTDVGDVSVAVPTVGLNTATWVPGTSAHSWQSVAASGMTIGYKGAQVAAKTMALAAIELMENEALIIAARLEFETKRGADFEYDSLLGDRPPPLDYRN
ncbi:MAG: amidohydrolase [Woeseiaceae bacterium]|jgi:aminobenzoyl-glutamate utilization protein B|nr:amidohydrolase [Woeseiaceae bacterium]|tara:strand:- start:1421 stop:2845 length:1425 start_codon:yes stop_codon:yes gene_type:complete